MKKVNGLKLWDNTIVDLDAISGFTSPFIRSENLPYGSSDRVHCMEFVIHTHPSKITISEELPSSVAVIQDPLEQSYVLVKATNENTCNKMGVPDISKVRFGWLTNDGHYTIEPNERMLVFQEFQSKFDALVRLWNNGKDTQYLTIGEDNTTAPQPANLHSNRDVNMIEVTMDMMNWCLPQDVVRWHFFYWEKNPLPSKGAPSLQVALEEFEASCIHAALYHLCALPSFVDSWTHVCAIGPNLSFVIEHSTKAEHSNVKYPLSKHVYTREYLEGIWKQQEAIIWSKHA